MEKEIWKIWSITKSNRWGKRTIEVSDQGRLKINGIITEPNMRAKCGYAFISGGILLHRAVAELFVFNPDPEHKTHVDHINTDIHDNRACNLRWVTPKENSNNPITRKHNSEGQKRYYETHTVIRGPHLGKTKQLMRESHLGKKLGPQSEETKKKRSISMKRVWEQKRNNKNIQI